jgi:hypothetical protein
MTYLLKIFELIASIAFPTANKNKGLIVVDQGTIINSLNKYLDLRNIEISMNNPEFLKDLEKYLSITSALLKKEEIIDRLALLEKDNTIFLPEKEERRDLKELYEKLRLIKENQENNRDAHLIETLKIQEKETITKIYQNRNIFLSDTYFRDKEELKNNSFASNYLSIKGVCSGLSHLWAFSQRQEDLKDNDDNLHEISKLRNLINKLVSWYKNGGKSEEIDWYETHKISDIKLIKSEDVEVLISTINLLQGDVGNLFGESLQGYHFFESVKTGIVTAPKKIEYTLPYTINKENLLSELNHSIEPELLTTISLRGNKGSHSISVYMKKDGKIIFYDPNLGEFDCATDMNKLVDLIATGPSIKQQIQLFLGYISNNKPSYMKILKIFIKEGIMKYFTPNKYNNFAIETWYFGKNKALEKKV